MIHQWEVWYDGHNLCFLSSSSSYHIELFSLSSLRPGSGEGAAIYVLLIEIY